ncbi:probable myosin-binding protein 5 [Lycium ferocissimum]|uniref:probable myosin-binding protein 5 n=1 Tax=Lycium ferocissimum TaxID=112874 RepID=UPI0028166E3F|nr:probable myosin-binding protein 5 [Lycium ferocissimum]
MALGSFKCSFDQKWGKFTLFFLYAILEWVLIIVLFVDGFLAFFSYEFAKFFELNIPCLLCTRIDHVLVHRTSNFYYNESICEIHKKDLSSLAYCHVHKKLSEIKNMCEGCLLSFATERDADCDRYKSLAGVLQKDIDCFVVDDVRLSVKTGKKELDEAIQIERGIVARCSCCGEPLKMRSKFSRNASINGRSYSQAPAPSPRASPRAPLLGTWRTIEEVRHLDSPRARYTELKFSPEDEGPSNGGKEDMKAVAVPLLPDSDIDSSCKTPNNTRNRFFGIPLSDSAQASPRLSHHRPRKSWISDKLDVASEANDTNSVASDLEDDVLQRLKRQVRLDRKSLVALYMELDEERSASAIAANNAMAMITRLQAEKAAVEMEAFQYQRMMEEQAEYDQEALQFMQDELLKKEEEMKLLQVELETYREKFGHIKTIGSEVCEVDADEDYQELKSQCLSSISERSDCASPDEADHHRVNERLFECSAENRGVNVDESQLDFEKQRSYLMGLLTDVVEKIKTSPEEGPRTSVSNMIEERGNENKVLLTREVSLIRERLRAIEAESGFLKHAAMTLQSGDEGSKLLTEIAQHLQKLRHTANTSSEYADAGRQSN